MINQKWKKDAKMVNQQSNLYVEWSAEVIGVC